MFLRRYEGYGPLRRDELKFGTKVLTFRERKNFYQITQDHIQKNVIKNEWMNEWMNERMNE